MVNRLRVKPTAALSVLLDTWRHPANRNHRGTSVGRALWFQVRGRALGKDTVVPLGRSSVISARLDDAGSRRAAYSPIPDFAEMNVWLNTLQNCDLFVDVGANVGLYSLLAAERGAEVIAFEPLPRAREQLDANLALNGYTAEVIAAAVSDKHGRMSMAGVDAQRMHLTDSAGPAELEAEVVTLDSVIGDRTVHGLKVDVEGAERLVLGGARQALADQRIQLMQLEWNETSLENYGESREMVAEMLDRAGYELLRPNASGQLEPLADISPGPDVFARPRAQSEVSER